jgi:hypothetical protein
MASNKPSYLHSLRFTANQREALDAIGYALKHRQIDFFVAVELSDQVKAGQVDRVLKTLEEITGKPVKLTDLLGYSDETN